MQILEDNERLYIKSPDGKSEIAEITFSRIGDDKASINHTYVSDDYQGQGIAGQLFNLVIEKMQQEGRKIIPICSYAKQQFERRPELQTILAKF
ncbi:GNAT family N-acetyltransferase [Orbus mooreae]|uniref:GNAT family N-acetyltransferase n=1 Tax=Orbus mooreae TaxID=3074107 RepID=UPI00370DA13A